MQILIKNIDEIYTGKNGKTIKNGYLIIDEHKISKIGNMHDFQRDKFNFDRVINGEGKIALPGFINTHTHAAMTLLRGYADDMPLDSWLKDKIWPFEASLNKNDIYWGTMLAIIEMLQTGTTSFADMYFEMDIVAKAVKETGMRAVLSQGLIEANDGEEGLNKAIEFCNNWNCKAEGRITTMLAPHAPYTCSDSYFKKIILQSEKHNLPINIHVAETKNEYESILQKHKISPVKYLNKMGLFNRPVLAAHCVYLEQDDMDILSQNDIGVAYNPASNMKLGSGIAPVNNLYQLNINIGFGTDGVASNNNLDLIEEARLGSYLQKVISNDPTVLNTHNILEMLTLRGAKALRLNDAGLLEEGYLADLVLIDILESPHFYPGHNYLSNLFYAGNGNDVKFVFVNGKLLYENGKLLTIDKDKVYYHINKIIKQKNL